MNLREATKDLHHAAEQHPIGAAMARGDIDGQTWADWLQALFTVHSALDPHLDASMQRIAEIALDLQLMGISTYGSLKPRGGNKAAEEFAAKVRGGIGIDGAAYVFTGAHLMGGAVIERRIDNRLPCLHLRWNDRRRSIEDWKPLREKGEATDYAKLAFKAVIDIMDEIQAKGSL